MKNNILIMKMHELWEEWSSQNFVNEFWKLGILLPFTFFTNPFLNFWFFKSLPSSIIFLLVIWPFMWIFIFLYTLVFMPMKLAIDVCQFRLFFYKKDCWIHLLVHAKEISFLYLRHGFVVCHSFTRWFLQWNKIVSMDG